MTLHALRSGFTPQFIAHDVANNAHNFEALVSLAITKDGSVSVFASAMKTTEMALLVKTLEHQFMLILSGKMTR